MHNAEICRPAVGGVRHQDVLKHKKKAHHAGTCIREAKKARGNESPRAFKTIIQVCRLKELSLCVSADGGFVGTAVVERDDVDTGGHVQAARFTG